MDKLLLYKALKNKSGAEISASGNPVTLSGTLADSPLKECKIYGWSKQETTIGAQLFNASKFDEIEQYGVKLSVKDGVIYAEGTPTQNAWITAKLTADEIKKVFKNGKLTIKSEKVNNCNFTVGLYFEFIPTSFAADGSSIELTIPENIADGCIYYYVNLIKDTEMIGGCKIMLYQDGNGTWEPYTGGKPSPSPEYPQEIESTGTVSTNLFDKDSISVNYVIEVDGKLVLSAGYDSSDFIPVSSGTYTITATGSVRCKTYDKDKKPFTINTYTDININNGGTFEIAKNVKYIRFSMYHPNVDTIMLNRGSTALPYEAYKSEMIDVTVHGKNLFNLEYALNQKNWSGPSGYWYIPYYVGKGNTVSVTYGAEIPVGLRVYICIHDYPGKTDNAKIWLYHSVGGNLINNKCTFIAETDYIYLNAAGDYLSVIKKYMTDLQIEVSPSPTGYEPYHTPQSLSIQTPTGLPAIPVTSGGNYTDASGQQWIADYIDIKRGKYVQNIRILELTGQEPYIVAGTSYFSGSSANMYIIASDMLKDGAVMCNCLSKKPYVWSIKSAVGCTTNMQQIHLRFPKATIGVNEDAGIEETKTAYKNYIKALYDAGKPIVVHYILADPIERDLTQSEIQAYQNLVTYAGTTIVENDAECYMEVSAGGGDTLRAKKLALILGD
nr:MAG TPA: hypothetical protein [Caudoviricetes sp.]